MMKTPMLSSWASARRSSIWTLNPGNALEFIERAAGNAEPPAANHRHPDFVAGQQRREHERDLVADAARGMLVDLRGSAGRIIQDASAFHHRLGEMMGLRRRHSLEENRHRPGAHLIVGDFAARKSGDEVRDFLRGQFAAFAFFFDECRNVHGKNSGCARAWIPTPAREPQPNL